MPSEQHADSFRRWGYLQAALDPLGRIAPFAHPDLDGTDPADAEKWRAIYCGSIGAQFMHMPDADRCRFIAERMEAEPAQPDRRRILQRLAEVELFEAFLHARYVGTKRYSLEGAAALVPLIDELLDSGAASGAKLALIGMSHRGRLPVMARIVNVPPSLIFAGFEDLDPRGALGGGDVKYHLGATGDYRTASGATMAIHLVSNPSHLEAVDPVLMGRTYARQKRIGADGPVRVLPIAVHGDAAFAGQGIAAETLNLAGLPGFSVGGTIHIVVNNLIGFTTEPSRLHSSRFAAEMALRLSVPILHVNGEDPDAVVRVARLALEYRTTFASDVVIDLIGYRRYGHSEVDDPTTTQPRLYRQIAQRDRLWQSYAVTIGAAQDEIDAMRGPIEAELERELATGRAMTAKPILRRLPEYWNSYVGGARPQGSEIATGVPETRLQEIAQKITSVPDGFAIHPKVAQGLQRRLAMGLGDAPIDWGMAEALAFGSLLLDGKPVRFAGQDARRGTFNQRHAVWIDQETGGEHVPLQHLNASQGTFFEILDTPLSEAAAVGFEYGFSRDYPEALICWEAQFGDFVNGAQVILDQFVSAAEDKWGLLSGLVLLLPHGFEGQGPEHSSARPERFLQLAAEDNMQICQPTTAAQYFHLLRRQVLRTWRKPLVVLTPKGMLRLPAAASPRSDLAEGGFRTVLAETRENPRRILVCSGRLAHELRAERDTRNFSDVAIVALEQLYPFPDDELDAALGALSGAREIVWVQEEPGNMGAESFVRPRLQRLAGGRHVTTVHRSESASPATGSPKAHAIEQKKLMELAFARFG